MSIIHRFENDYSEGACPEIIEALTKTNLMQSAPYGTDEHCRKAAELIRKEIGKDADIHFLVGGTQTNMTVIAAALRVHECVVAAGTAHIACHETGAIESTGHKVLTVPSENGKLSAEEVRRTWERHENDGNREHIAKPKLVYISHPTEIGTLYTKKELEDLYAVCRECGLYLFLDGARLGYGLTAGDTDLTMKDIAANTDVFYIGGTKCGALFGEAVVIGNKEIERDFRYVIKQHGGMLAKGWLLGIQFETLFTDGLYYKICRRANNLAMIIKKALLDKGYELYMDTSANQTFVIMTEQRYKELSEYFVLSYTEPLPDDKCIVRICTSWTTPDEAVNALISAL